VEYFPQWAVWVALGVVMQALMFLPALRCYMWPRVAGWLIGGVLVLVGAWSDRDQLLCAAQLLVWLWFARICKQ
jgi:hypothetical protein